MRKEGLRWNKERQQSRRMIDLAARRAFFPDIKKKADVAALMMNQNMEGVLLVCVVNECGGFMPAKGL